MKRLHLSLGIAGLACCLVVGTLLPVFAADTPSAAPPRSITPGPIIITEVQTGLATASDEFVELYNAGKTAVDLTGWQVRYQNATATVSSLVASIGADGGQPVLEPGAYYVLHSVSVVLPIGVAGQVMPATLSAADKSIGVFAPDGKACRATVQDAVAWGVSTMGEGSALVPSAGDKLLYRYIDAGLYTDTNNNLYDFGSVVAAAEPSAILPTPGAATTATLPAGATVQEGTPSPMTSVKVSGCSLPEEEQNPSTSPPVATPTTSPPSVTHPAEGHEDEGAPAKTPTIPARNNGLYAPQISELLPNPAKPQTDAQDEFIELYNSNTAPFELSGFSLESGTTTKRRYVFPDGTLLPAKSFTAFLSKDTNISLSNTQGQVWLLDPLGRIIAQSEPYAAAKDGQSWLTADSKWQWSTQPTPSALNVLRTPAPKAAKKGTAQGAARPATATGVKGASTGATTPTTTAPDTSNADAKEAEGFNPLHPAVLAITGVVAISYGVYEYRRDLANKYHQFRANRAARAEARRSTARR